MPPRFPNDDDSKIVPFAAGTNSDWKAEDDPEQWVFPEESNEDFRLRALASAIVDLDPALTKLLVESAKGDESTGELVRQLDAWQTLMGGGKKAQGQGAGNQPWLV